MSSTHSASARRHQGVNVVRPALLAIVAALAPAAAAAAEPIVLGMPLDCQVGRTCAIQQYVDHDPSVSARDYRCGTLSYDGHNGTDFRLPTLAAQHAGVDVLAAAEGVVLRVRDRMEDVSIAGKGIVSVGNRLCGNGVVVGHADGWETQYCHMEKGSVRVRPGERVAAGARLGRVGLSGATVFPHLHFTVRHDGEIVDPFAFGAAAGTCGAGIALWDSSLQASLAYRPRAVLNAGFSTAPVTMDEIEAGTTGQGATDRDPPAIVAYVRSIGLKAGDVQHLVIRDARGDVVVDHTVKPLDRNQAQSMVFAGKKRPQGGWPPGSYRATYIVSADGETVLEESFTRSF